MTTLGRAASLRVAYASAVQDVVMLREENARLKVAVNHEAVQRDMRHKAWLQEKARADAAEAERDALKAENADLLAEADAAHFGETAARIRLMQMENELMQYQTFLTAHKTMPALLNELDRLRAFVAEHGVAMDTPLGSTHRHICRECGAMGDVPHAEPIEHAPGCIVAEARQKKEVQG